QEFAFVANPSANAWRQSWPIKRQASCATWHPPGTFRPNMGENSKTPPGAKALINALDARIEEIATQGERLMEQFSKLDATARVMMKQLTALRKEQADLEAMKRRYLGRPTKKEA